MHVMSRILIGWLPSIFSVNIVHCTSKLIHTEVQLIGTSNRFQCTFVYGFNEAKNREVLWCDLESIAKQVNGPWLVLV